MTDDHRSIALRASLRRVLPTIAGVVGAVVAIHVVPLHVDRQDSAFFAAAAQILPVLLLALVLEANLFGIAVKVPAGPWRENASVYVSEYGRKTLEYLSVILFLSAELVALYKLSNFPSNGTSTWLVAAAIGWALVAAGSIAVSGGRRPVANMSLDAKPIPGSQNDYVMLLGMGNVYGDDDMSPLMNFLVPDSAVISTCHEDGSIIGDAPTLTTAEKLADASGNEHDVKYVSEFVPLPEGQSAMRLYRVSNAGVGQFPVKLKLSHGKIPRGERILVLQVGS